MCAECNGIGLYLVLLCSWRQVMGKISLKRYHGKGFVMLLTAGLMEHWFYGSLRRQKKRGYAS